MATGFDAAYFAKQAQKATGLESVSQPTASLGQSSAASSAGVSSDDDDLAATSSRSDNSGDDMRGIDMDLDQPKPASEDFSSKEPMPNIWSIDNDNDDDQDPANKFPEPPAGFNANSGAGSSASAAGKTADGRSILDDDDNQPSAFGTPTVGSGSASGNLDDDELEKPSFLRRLAKRRKSGE